MKEDYLWDKTGEDFEIEKLENALAAFRYQETAPPALPAKIIPFEKKTPRGFFRLAFAFAGGAALIAVCLGVWFQVSNKKIELAKDATNNAAPQINQDSAREISNEKQTDSAGEKIKKPEQSVERKFIQIRKIVPAIARQNNLTARNIAVKKPPAKLTSEEKYAYNQLMLALSITGSKLRLVKDKIDGVEEQKPVFENGL